MSASDGRTMRPVSISPHVEAFTNVEVDGAKAVATVALDRRWRARAWLDRQDGRWRLSGLFGTPPGLAQRTAEEIADASFPAARGSGVEAPNGDGEPCPDLSQAAYPKVSGGCRVELSTPVIPLTILTPFGDFEFERCAIDYRVRVDSSGRTWTEDFEVTGDERSVACGDVNPCYDYSVEDLAPWRGRIHPDGQDAFVHRTDMCLQTCVGHFVGELTMRLVRDGDAWRAEPVDGGGDSGFRFDSPLRVKGDLDIDATGS